MRRYLLIFAALMLAFSSKAHAAACSGGATCISVQDGGGSGATVTNVAVTFSPNNTATNTLTAIMYVNCATDWTGSGPVRSSRCHRLGHMYTGSTPVAITSIKVFTGSGSNFAAGSTLTLSGR